MFSIFGYWVVVSVVCFTCLLGPVVLLAWGVRKYIRSVSNGRAIIPSLMDKICHKVGDELGIISICVSGVIGGCAILVVCSEPAQFFKDIGEVATALSTTAGYTAAIAVGLTLAHKSIKKLFTFAYKVQDTLVASGVNASGVSPETKSHFDELVVGGVYEDRRGKQVKINRSGRMGQYSFSSECGRSYTKKGHYWSSGVEDPADLVKRIG